MQAPHDLDKLANTLNGLAILGCLPGSPAAAAGLRYGDILLSVNGHPTSVWTDYVAFSRLHGDRMSLRVFRNGAELDCEVALDPLVRTPTETLTQVVRSGLLPSRAGAVAAVHLDALARRGS
ncbi:MAG: PDZ domain-containing protein [Myxococcaceae bacterium]|nr:PDZ domain-containing protein [Myxococcaceae bacterium]